MSRGLKRHGHEPQARTWCRLVSFSILWRPPEFVALGNRKHQSSVVARRRTSLLAGLVRHVRAPSDSALSLHPFARHDGSRTHRRAYIMTEVPLQTHDPCWLASLGYVRLGARRAFIPQEAHTATAVRLLGADAGVDAPSGAHEANMLFGIVSIKLVGAYSFMNVYGQCEREQISFWEALLDEHVLDGAMFQFDVGSCSALEQQVPLLQCSDRKLRGFVVDLEAGQAERLWDVLPASARRAVGGRMPCVALRVPPQHAILILRRLWRSVLLPDTPRLKAPAAPAPGGRGGSATMYIDWVRLGVHSPEEIDIPEVLLTKPELDPGMCLQMADRLRCVASQIDQDTDFGADDFHNSEIFVHVLQSMYDQTNPTYLTKMVKDLRSRVALSFVSTQECRKLKYNVTWMLRVMLLSDCLRNSAGLAQAVKQSLHLVVPPVLIPIFGNILDDPKGLQPNSSTVSRWRLLLDGAYMRWHRRLNCDRGYVRYLMSDSSSQRGRTFQLTAVQSISVLELPRCFREVNDLITTWRFVVRPIDESNTNTRGWRASELNKNMIRPWRPRAETSDQCVYFWVWFILGGFSITLHHYIAPGWDIPAPPVGSQ